jgi:hypothetical protein
MLDFKELSNDGTDLERVLLERDLKYIGLAKDQMVVES